MAIAGVERFELSTYALTVRHSAVELHAIKIIIAIYFQSSGRSLVRFNALALRII